MPPANLPTILSYALSFTATFKYPLVFVAAVLEGPIVMIACGFLLRLGFFSFPWLFITIFAGEMIGDLGWYYLGRWFANPILRKWGKFIGVTPDQFEKVKAAFLRHPRKILILSKMTMGLGFAVGVLMVAGSVRTKLKTFYFINGLGELWFLSAMLALGYFFGHLYTTIANSFKVAFIVASAIVVVLAVYGFSRYVKMNRSKFL
jgi:membrane protein DedA with SNARE-associated domain